MSVKSANYNIKFRGCHPVPAQLFTASPMIVLRWPHELQSHANDLSSGSQLVINGGAADCRPHEAFSRLAACGGIVEVMEADRHGFESDGVSNCSMAV
ncbi:hypothetical protein VC83_05590 [Pseudogymnoascus destructans]|uniref:Uncharacterized protein n=1 Tax=Pseudogymnoascus destructans TaxID=655981 RepID=A0A177A9U4_9PEZI|nr:uncharacterized protein VC83_05590 [Pseudogymnoascus destructans]OAF57864.1 hypothetical protein VC83_05590 [Pseudogymnoascus destructans]